MITLPKKLNHPGCGCSMYRSHDTFVIQFDTVRTTAGNSALNGGVCSGMRAVLNHNIPRVETARDLPGGSVEQYLRRVASDYGIAPAACSGLLTAARIENTAIVSQSFRQLWVQAAVTAGIDVNGGRAGDPAAYFEEDGFYSPAGTINVLLSVNVDLPPETLLKAVITATEAKTAALQELMAPSRYSTGLATGSGTDGIIVAADPGALLRLTDAGLHSKLGELIGSTVKEGVHKALEMESGLSPQRQLNALERLKRYQVNEQYCWQRAAGTCLDGLYGRYNGILPGVYRDADVAKPTDVYNRKSRSDTGLYTAYCQVLRYTARKSAVVAVTAALIHIQDELIWGLLPEKQAIQTAGILLNAALKDMLTCNTETPWIPETHGEYEATVTIDEPITPEIPGTLEKQGLRPSAQSIIDMLVDGLNCLVVHDMVTNS